MDTKKSTALDRAEEALRQSIKRPFVTIEEYDRLKRVERLARELAENFTNPLFQLVLDGLTTDYKMLMLGLQQQARELKSELEKGV